MTEDILNLDISNYEKALLYDLRYSSGERNDLLAKELFNYRTKNSMMSRPGGANLHELNKYPHIKVSLSGQMQCWLRQEDRKVPNDQNP